MNLKSLDLNLESSSLINKNRTFSSVEPIVREPLIIFASGTMKVFAGSSSSREGSLPCLSKNNFETPHLDKSN